MKISKVIWILLFACIAPLSYANDIVRWVDKDGKIHFGHSVPAEYVEQAEKMDVQDSNTTESVFAFPQPPTRAASRRRSGASSQQPQYSNDGADQLPVSDDDKRQRYTPTREECRDLHGPNRVKDRTVCFKRSQ